MRNSSVGGGGFRDGGMRAAARCLERRSLKRGVMSVMAVEGVVGMDMWGGLKSKLATLHEPAPTNL